MPPIVTDKDIEPILSQLKTPKARQAFNAVIDKVIATKNPFILITDEHLTIKTKKIGRAHV